MNYLRAQRPSQTKHSTLAKLKAKELFEPKHEAQRSIFTDVGTVYCKDAKQAIEVLIELKDLIAQKQAGEMDVVIEALEKFSRGGLGVIYLNIAKRSLLCPKEIYIINIQPQFGSTLEYEFAQSLPTIAFAVTDKKLEDLDWIHAFAFMQFNEIYIDDDAGFWSDNAKPALESMDAFNELVEHTGVSLGIVKIRLKAKPWVDVTISSGSFKTIDCKILYYAVKIRKSDRRFLEVNIFNAQGTLKTRARVGYYGGLFWSEEEGSFEELQLLLLLEALNIQDFLLLNGKLERSIEKIKDIYESEHKRIF